MMASLGVSGQSTPDKIYGDLFHDIQMARVFPDGKTFVDMLPKQKPSEIMKEYKSIKKNPPADFSLERFAKERFELPASKQQLYQTDGKDVVRPSSNETRTNRLKAVPCCPFLIRISSREADSGKSITGILISPCWG